VSGIAWLAFSLTLGGYAVASLLGAGAVAALAPAVARLEVSATRRARLLLALLLLPSAAGLVVSVGMVLPAFLWLQPHESTEVVSPVLALLAVLALLVLGAGAARVRAAWRATRRTAARWAARGTETSLPGVPWKARVIEDPFPVLAVVGVREPGLVVARQVREALEPREWEAVIAHERAHAASQDNLKSLLLRSCPDVLQLMPAGRRLAEAWKAAVEDAADDAVAATGRPAALHLASALVKVGRLVPPGAHAASWPSAHLVDGRLEQRVRRLLESKATVRFAAAELAGWCLVGALALLAATVLAGTPGLHHAVYEVAERALLLS
jgi:Zn-dependent protease with chaperone function